METQDEKGLGRWSVYEELCNEISQYFSVVLIFSYTPSKDTCVKPIF